MNKKDFNNIKIPENIDKIIDSSFDDAYKIRNRKKVKRNSGIIVAGLLFFIIAGITKPAIASAIPPLQLIFEQLQERLNNNGDNVKYVTEVNKSTKSNGVEVTLQDTSFDGRYLYVSYRVKSDTPFKVPGIEISETQLLYEHSEKLSFTNEVLDSSGTAGILGKFIDDNTFEGIQRYDLGSLKEDIPSSFKFKVLINAFRCIPIVGDDRAELIRVGDWGFEVNVNSRTDLSKNIEVNSKSDDGISIKNIIVNPFEIIVETEREENSLGYYIEITDSYGNILDSIEETKDKNLSESHFSRAKMEGNKLIVNIYSTSSGNQLIFTEEINID